MGGERITLGEVFDLKNDVRRRSFDNFSWHDLGNKEALFHNDRIFTDKDSTAKLKFSSGNEINVSEESLFKITQETDGINLNIEQGVVFATLNNANEAFVVKVGDQIYEIKSDNSKIKISTENGNKELSVLEGQAKVKLGNVEETISKGVRVVLTNDSYEIKKSWPEEFTPLDGKIFYVNESNVINFEFSEAVEKLHLSSNRPALENGEVIDVKGKSTSVKNLKEGIYYWQVSQDLNISSDKSFEVIYERVPEFENISESENVVLLNRSKKIYTEKFDEIELQVNGGEYTDFDYSDGELNLSFEEVGEYKVSYRNKSEEHPYALYSKEALIKVVSSPSEITLKRPFQGEEYYFYTPNKIRFSWQAQDLFADVKTYIVINNNRYPTVGNSFTMDVTETGEYTWSLEYFLNDELITKSKENEFNVTFDRDNSALKEGRKIVVKKPGDVIDLTWRQGASDKEDFIVEIARDRKFENLNEVIKANSNNTKFLVKELGTFYWRVKNEENKFVAPVKIIVVPPPPPASPKIKKIEKRVEVNKLSPLWSLLDLLISPAQAQESVRLTWEAVNDVKEYRIQILDGTKIVLDEKVGLNQFYWKDYSTGHFQWRVAAIDYWNQESPFSEVEDLIITKKFGGADAVDLVSPRHGTKIKEGNVVELNFKKVRGDKFYLEISKDKYFKEIKEIPLGLENSYRFKNNLDDSFYWRVRAVEKGDILYSKKRRIDVLKVRKPVMTKVADPKGQKKRSPYYFSYLPEMTTYEKVSSGKNLKVDDTNFISFQVGKNIKLAEYEIDASVLHSAGLVFEDIAFNRTRLQVKTKKNQGRFGYGSILQVEYRSELSYSGSVVESTSEFFFNVAPYIGANFGEFNFQLGYFIMNYKGLDGQLSYKLSDKYEVGLKYQSLENTSDSSKSSSLGLKLQISL